MCFKGCRFVPYTFSETSRHRWYNPLNLNIGVSPGFGGLIQSQTYNPVFHSYSSNCVELWGLILMIFCLNIMEPFAMFEKWKWGARLDDCSILGFVNFRRKFDKIGLGDLMVFVS